jgi:hypothetical protein
LVFDNFGEIDYVKTVLGAEYDQVGGPQNGRMTEDAGGPGIGGGYVWDTDSGRKTTACPGGPGQPIDARHYRIYADAGDALYNLSWGYYVFGTIHYDYDECGDAPWFGWSENAEGWLVWRWRATGYYAWEDLHHFYNAEPYHVEGDHIWENDGRASFMWVPDEGQLG